MRKGLCTVVPISTGAPRPQMPYHVELPGLALPPPFDAGPNWVKCDMVNAVSLARLDLFRDGRDGQGRRLYRQVILPEAELRAVRAGILAALGLLSLTRHL